MTDPATSTFQPTPAEFVLWLNGAFDMLASAPPSQEQWDMIREKTLEQMGHIVRERMRAKTAVSTTASLAQAYNAQTAAMHAKAMSAIRAISPTPSKFDDKSFGVITIE